MIKEHGRQTAFLQSLMLCCEGEPARRLLGRLAKARREDRVMRVALLLAVAVGVVALMTYGYSAVLVPEFFLRASTLLRVIQVLGVASLVCAGGFAAYWWWTRAVFNALHEECRCFVMLRLQARLIVLHEENHLQPAGKPLPHRPPADSATP